MPVIKGFGRRDGEDRETGGATILVGFPDAQKKVLLRDPQTGAITVHSEPDPHQRAMNLADLREMQTRLPEGSAIRKFYRDAERMLLDHIESAPAGIPSTAYGQDGAPVHGGLDTGMEIFKA